MLSYRLAHASLKSHRLRTVLTSLGVMIGVFIFAGVLEIISIMFRPVSLSFRLYGNIFAGESTLETMTALGGTWFGWLLPIPFYFMELLVGLAQAMVFMLLTTVFTFIIMPEDGHDSH